jgi:hypothetical protein
MFILAYLFLGGFVWLVGLVLFQAARAKMGNYSALAFLFAIAGLILFALFSWWAGILPLRFGGDAVVAYSLSIPDDYLRRGATGIAILVVGVLGVVSPLLAARLVGQSKKPVG